MKLKHNKKRNTAILYQILIQELTKSILRNNNDKKTKLLEIIKTSFVKGSVLYKDLKCYEEIQNSLSLDIADFKQVMQEVRSKKAGIDTKQLFNEQTKLINRINNKVSKSSFNNFVPNYKNLATIYQIFGLEDHPSKRVVLENRLLEEVSSKETKEEKRLVPLDNLVYKGFVEKFNEVYGNKLLESQQKLLQRYVSSLDSNNIEFKIYMNEELSKIKTALNGKYASKLDEQNREKLNEAISSFKNKKIDDEIIEKVLRIQELFAELEKN